jgi:hypothetical protein
MSVTPMELTEGQWTKVATNVQAGGIFIIRPKPTTVIYFHTIRDTGGTAPNAGHLESEGFPLDLANQISAGAPIDVYIWPVGGNGNIRVDLPGVS